MKNGNVNLSTLGMKGMPAHVVRVRFCVGVGVTTGVGVGVTTGVGVGVTTGVWVGGARSYHFSRLMKFNEGDKKLYSNFAPFILFKSKNKPRNVYFNIGAFYDFSIFGDTMLKTSLAVNNVYTVYIKIRYDINRFIMVGNQFGFNFQSETDF